MGAEARGALSSPETSGVQPISDPLPVPSNGNVNVERAGGLDLSACALEFLQAVGAGEDRAVELAATLATRLLEETGARLALSVLEGGPLLHALDPYR
jgi:hypothetical protein